MKTTSAQKLTVAALAKTLMGVAAALSPAQEAQPQEV
jgi:hypothetical protein